ncbi:hypothetical protein LCGC14_0224610 [marine sediment metagenome]|uniref:Uncharacterized protein n=1 Tax=marine sediment metagenome TaxID=412755 RepID=A0A0F9UTT1_9ZZZZ|nr:hypothetical protein [bacterium]
MAKEPDMIIHLNNEKIFTKMETVIAKISFSKRNSNDTNILLCGVIALLVDIDKNLRKLIGE